MCLKKPKNIIEDSSIAFSVSKTAFILQKPISNPKVTLLRCNPLKSYLNILNTLSKLFLPLIKIPYLSGIPIRMKGCLPIWKDLPWWLLICREHQQFFNGYK